MEDYGYSNAFDLTQDDDFVLWVKDPIKDPLLAVKWNIWLQQHMEKKEMVDEARCIILDALNEKQFVLDDGKESLLWSRIENTIIDKESNYK